MAQKTIAGKNIQVNEEGYLLNPGEWDRDVAQALADEIGLGALTDNHWKILEYLRKCHRDGAALTLRKVGNAGIVDMKTLYQLFPGGPLKKSSLVAGIPKPVSCV